MPEKILITGGAGNLACQLSFDLAARGDEVVLFDLAEAPVGPTAAGCRYVRGDVTDRETVASLLEQHQPDVIMHYASLLSGKSEQDRPLAWRVNMNGAFGLLEEAVARGIRKFFFPSSIAAYGGPFPCPVPEDFPQWPIGLYGVTKAAVETLGVYYHRRHGLDFRCIRVPIVISRYAHTGAASSYASRVFMESARRGRFTFQVRPSARPSLIYVKDVLRAMLLLLDAPEERLTRRVYNVQALAPTAEELAAAIRSRLPDASIDFDPRPEVVDLIESWPIEFDDTSARHDWGWQPQYRLDALADDFLTDLQSD